MSGMTDGAQANKDGQKKLQRTGRTLHPEMGGMERLAERLKAGPENLGRLQRPAERRAAAR